MKLLIIGGTRFVGRHLVETAIARNHEVTLSNRGTYAPVARDVETIAGDRYKDLAKLRDRRWDVVVDTCGYVPRAVTAAAEVLRDAVERYIFISSQSAYADVSVRGVDETATLAQLTSEQLDEANRIDTSGSPSYGKSYGGLKALCEQAAEQVMPNRVLIVRPGEQFCKTSRSQRGVKCRSGCRKKTRRSWRGSCLSTSTRLWRRVCGFARSMRRFATRWYGPGPNYRIPH